MTSRMTKESLANAGFCKKRNEKMFLEKKSNSQSK